MVGKGLERMCPAFGGHFRRRLWDVPEPPAFRVGQDVHARHRNIARRWGRRSGVVGRVLNRRPKLEVGSSIAVTGRSQAMKAP